jgi:pimeloyl-ACP methyl ester carboxylesterase
VNTNNETRNESAVNISLTASIQPQFRVIDGVKIRCADSGGSRKPTLLLTSPWPESLYAFRRVWDTLAAHARLVAIDLPGFGASERRDDLLSPRAMGGFLARTITEADLADRTSSRPTSERRRPCSLRRNIRGGSPAWSLAAVERQFQSSSAIDTIAGGVPDEIREDYLASYDGDRYAESMRYVRRYPEELPELADLLPQVATPVTIINGRNDRVVPVANAEFLDERLPNSRVRRIDAGHFVWEEAPAEYASIILDSITADAQ